MTRSIKVIILGILLVILGGIFYYYHTQSLKKVMDLPPLNPVPAKVLPRKIHNNETLQEQRHLLKESAINSDIDLQNYFDFVIQHEKSEYIDWDELYTLTRAAYRHGSAKSALYMYKLLIAEGVEKPSATPYYDPKRAFFYLEESAKKGEYSAQYRLGNIYGNIASFLSREASVYGVETDLAKGYAWTVLSLFNGKDEIDIISDESKITLRKPDYIESYSHKLPSSLEKRRFLDLLKEYEEKYMVKDKK